MRSSVRGRLACLVLAITLPAMLLVGLLVAQAYRNERELVVQHLLSTARALASVLDHQMGESEWLLKGLAAARELESGDIAAFEQRVRSIALEGNAWLVLADAQGQQLVNTRVPLGTALPRQSFDGEFRTTIERGQTYVSNVIAGEVPQRSLLFIAVPVMRRGQVLHTLSYVTPSLAFEEQLRLERFLPGAVISMVDRNGTIAVRYPAAERFIGEKARPEIVRAVMSAAEGSLPSLTLDGTRVLAVHCRAAQTGWSVTIGAPYAALYASAQRLLLMGLAASSVLMAVAIFMAMWIGRAVVRGVDTLVAETDAIGRGGRAKAGSSGLQETDYVVEAMRKSAQRLEERERDNAALTAALQRELQKQKEAEEASRRLAAIVESSADAIVGEDLNGVVTSWNGGAERILGYRADEMVGKPIIRLIPPERREEDRAILERIRRGERIEHFETSRRHKEGRLVPLSLTVSPVRDLEGRIVGASKIARDISHRRQIEAQQQALYQLVEAVNRAEALSDICDAALNAMLRCQHVDRAAILLSDENGVMRFKASIGLSPAYCRAVEGHSPWLPGEEQPSPLWIADVAQATLEPALRQAIEREGIRALGFVPLTYRKRLIGKFMLYYNAPHAFTAAELRPVETIASQVSFAIERQRSADALEALVDERTASLRQAVAQMEEFSYSVSHDLRAPTRAMCGYAEAILEEHGRQLDDVGRDLLRRIMRNSQRMDRLIQDLLTYSRISRREIQLEPVSVDKLVREVTLQYPDLRRERADIEVLGPLPDVLAHEPSLTQVVSNLLTNAVKFMPKGRRPHVRVGSERKGGRARVWFEDNGIGIKPEAQPRLFQMFERLHPEKHYEGTGIGLAIVRKAMERMNGTVGVESDGITGSRFWFELPVAEKTANGEARQAMETAVSSGGE